MYRVQYTQDVTKREQASVLTADLLVANTWNKQVSTNDNPTRF